MSLNDVPSGQDIEQAKNVFQRLADAIVQMTSLHEQVQQMQRDMRQMQDDLERLRRTNDSLEEALSHSRTARQELETKNAELAQNVHELRQGKMTAEGEAKHWQELAQTYERERDEARQRADHYKQEGEIVAKQLMEANEKLDAIQQGFQSIFGNSQPKATPQPEPVHHTGPAVEPMTQDQPAPEPVRLGEAEQPRRVYEGEPGFSWSGPTRWDSERNKYYHEAQ